MNTILLDGAAGTLLWDMAESAGVKKEPVWKYNIEHPEFVLAMHRRYIEAGADMIQTNTFTANRREIQRSSTYTVNEVITAAVRLAKQAAEGTDVGVYLSFGPLSAMLAPYGTLTAAETEDIYTEMVRCGAEAGADAIMLETFMDVRMAAIAAKCAVASGLPTVCSMTFAKRHKTMMGDSIQKIVDTLSPLGIAGVGMNCSFGPVEALGIIREFHEKTALPLYFKPNAGIGESYSAEDFVREVAPALDFVRYIGGCCGCDDAYIRALRTRIQKA